MHTPGSEIIQTNRFPVVWTHVARCEGDQDIKAFRTIITMSFFLELGLFKCQITITRSPCGTKKQVEQSRALGKER